MIRSRLGLKALGLCALVVGVMAVGGGGAQAEVGSHWNVNGSSIGSTLLPELQVKELEGNDLILLSKIAGKLIELLCTGAAFSAVKLGAEGIIDAGGRIHLTGCIFKFGGVVQPKCMPHTKGAPEGLILTESFHGLIKLHEEEKSITVLPDAGETFVTLISGKEGELNECAVGVKLPLSGKLSLKDANKSLATEGVTHLVAELAALTDLWILSKTAEHKVTVDGSAAFALTGAAHTGLKWSGTPG